MIIHNNAKISKDYTAHVTNTAYKIGDEFVVSQLEISRLFDFLHWSIFQIYAAIKVKFFDKNYEAICDEHGIIKEKLPPVDIDDAIADSGLEIK